MQQGGLSHGMLVGGARGGVVSQPHTMTPTPKPPATNTLPVGTPLGRGSGRGPPRRGLTG